MILPVLVLFGPTASGKTAVLDRLFGGTSAVHAAEIVSADSMQVYRGMDIGTAKPDAALLSRLPHHLIDIKDPSETFNVGDFVRLADAACRDISARGKLPVVCGGTGFYLKHFVAGLPETPPGDPEIRAKVQAELAERGSAALMEELRLCDPESAARIHVNDVYRLARALEVFRASGRPLSSFRASGGAGQGDRPDYRFLCLSLERDRADLYDRINRRARSMFEAGLPAEAAKLRGMGYGEDAPGMRAIGYKEFFLCSEAEIGGKLAAIEALVAQNSRHYAKRQIVFASSIPGIESVRADVDADALARIIAAKLDDFLGS